MNVIHFEFFGFKVSILGFPRDGTSRCPFVPGQGHFPCPGVPLSRDKGMSKCPGTNSSVPGRPGTKLLSYFAHQLHYFPIFVCCCNFSLFLYFSLYPSSFVCLLKLIELQVPFCKRKKLFTREKSSYHSCLMMS